MRVRLDLTDQAMGLLTSGAAERGAALPDHLRRLINLNLFLHQQAAGTGGVVVNGRHGRKQIHIR